MSNRNRLCIELAIVLAVLATVCAARVSRRAATTPPARKPGIDKFVGTWKHIGNLGPDGKLVPLDGASVPIKHVTPTHFTWFVVNPKDHTATIGFSGTCSVESGTYTESVESFGGPQPSSGTPSNAPTSSGDVLTFRFRYGFEGERWHHTFLAPPGAAVDPKWVGETQVWVRMKPGERFTK